MLYHAALICKDTLHGLYVASCRESKNVLHVSDRLLDDSFPTVNENAPHCCWIVAFMGSRQSGKQPI